MQHEDAEKSKLLRLSSFKNLSVPIPKGSMFIVVNLEKPDGPKEENQNVGDLPVRENLC